MHCIDLTSKRSKKLSNVSKHSKQRKTTKLIKLQWIASIWCQNDQNNAKLQTRSNYDEFASTWHQNYKKCWVTSQNIQNNAKLRKSSNYNELHRFDVKNIKPTQNYKSDLISMNLHRFDVRTIKTTQNYESDQIIMHCIDLTSKRSKKLSYVPKLQKRSNYNELHRFDVKTVKTTQNYKTGQITMNCIDLMSKRSKIAKLQKQSNSDQFASIWGQNDQNVEIRRKTTKVIKL